MEESNETGKVIGAALLGAAFGVALGVLMAPDKGSETRKKIVKGIKDLMGDLKDALKETENDLHKEKNEKA